MASVNVFVIFRLLFRYGNSTALEWENPGDPGLPHAVARIQRSARQLGSCLLDSDAVQSGISLEAEQLGFRQVNGLGFVSRHCTFPLRSKL
jgi:hypothetical protein